MKHRATSWLVAAALGMTSVLAGTSRLAAQQPTRPAPAVIAAWEKVGAEFGWIWIVSGGDLVWQPGKEQPASGAFPGFNFRRLPLGKLPTEKLALAHTSFGVWIHADVNDADLKQLAGLTQLHALILQGRSRNDRDGISDAGLKELAGLKDLKVLSLSRTKITGAGLKELFS